MRQEPVLFLHGRSLACGLGANIEQALHALQNGPPNAALPADAPHYQRIPVACSDPALTPAEAWRQRARELVCRAANEALADRDGLLLLASASFDIGALEHLEHWPHDGYVFAERVARWLDWRGPVAAVNTACTSSGNALRSASTSIAAGLTSSALVLGFELANQFTVGGFTSLQLLSPSGRARPWAADRDGLVLGEAVAALHLRATPLSPAGTLARWCVRASANVVDGLDASGVNPVAVRAAIDQALAQSGLAPEDIDLIKLHAAAGLRSDALEWQALCQVFAQPPARITLKHLCGHALGASTAAEVALLTASLDAGTWPAQTMTNAAHRAATAPPDAAMASNVVDAQLSDARPQRLRHVLALFLGFGGGHTALILEDTLAAAQADGHATSAPFQPLPNNFRAGGAIMRATAPPQHAALQAHVGMTAADHAQPEPAWCWQVSGRSTPSLPPAWRADLATRLGERPRRLGAWAELALFGARTCLDAAGEAQLPSGALLRLGSRIGPTANVLRALADMRTGTPPLPYTFLQSQPAVALAAIAAHFGWRGDAVLLNQRSPLEQLRAALAAAQSLSPPSGLLIGWVEEAPEPCSHWLRLVPRRMETSGPWRKMVEDDWVSARVQHLSLNGPMLMALDGGWESACSLR